jgi:hypothetical protein
MKCNIDADVLKMTIVGNIQNMERYCYGEIFSDFDDLWKLSYDALIVLRDNLLVKYNDLVEARKFGAEMIYKR